MRLSTKCTGVGVLALVAAVVCGSCGTVMASVGTHRDYSLGVIAMAISVLLALMAANQMLNAIHLKKNGD